MCAEMSRDDRMISSSVPRAWLPVAPLIASLSELSSEPPNAKLYRNGTCCSGTFPQPCFLTAGDTLPPLPACCPGQEDLPQIPSTQIAPIPEPPAFAFGLGGEADLQLGRWKPSVPPATCWHAGLAELLGAEPVPFSGRFNAPRATPKSSQERLGKKSWF